jgi:hypothetical protein
MNEEDKIIRKKYVLKNTKTVVWGFHRVVVRNQVFSGFVPFGWVICSEISKKRTASFSGLWVSSRTQNPDDESGTFFLNVGKQLPNNTEQQPTRPASSNTKTGMQLMFKRCVISSGVMRQPSR